MKRTKADESSSERYDTNSKLLGENSCFKILPSVAIRTRPSSALVQKSILKEKFPFLPIY